MICNGRTLRCRAGTFVQNARSQPQRRARVAPPRPICFPGLLHAGGIRPARRRNGGSAFSRIATGQVVSNHSAWRPAAIPTAPIWPASATRRSDGSWRCCLPEAAVMSTTCGYNGYSLSWTSVAATLSAGVRPDRDGGGPVRAASASRPPSTSVRTPTTARRRNPAQLHGAGEAGRGLIQSLKPSP